MSAIPENWDFKFATWVVLVTTNGAVPVASVLVSCPETLSDAPVAAPMFGVISVQLVFITKVLPVPVWAATEVALPILVIGPVRLALVVTVPAVVAKSDTATCRLGTNVVLLTINGLTPVATLLCNCPVTLNETPVAAPMFGVISVGPLFITKVLPIPV